ncbi:hypothetical protein EON80_12515 [bacterium]|nr:MAG: hypothetical protein EON80_12515 [bacterium]
MKEDVDLSPEQKKAKDLYQTTLTLSLVCTPLLLMPLGVVISTLLRKLGLEMGGYIFGAIGGSGFCLGHLFALWRVRRNGLSQEAKSIETVQKTASQFSGEPFEFYLPKVLATAYLVGLGLMGWLAWWLSHDSRRTGEEALGIPVMALCAVFIPTFLILLSRPLLRIDEYGVIGPPSPWWWRRIKWSQVVSCEIATITNVTGDQSWREFQFKNEAGKTLLRFLPLTYQINSEAKSDAIEAEIRRRLTA